MAEDQVGVRRDQPSPTAPWTKLFTAFKIALDPKKLLLAAAGILVMWLGWWVLAVVFFGPRTLPQWSDYEKAYDSVDTAWVNFKEARDRYNLIYELAGRIPDDPRKARVPEPEDVANTYDEFEKIKKAYEEIDKKYGRLGEVVEFSGTDQKPRLKVKKTQLELEFKTANAADLAQIGRAHV